MYMEIVKEMKGFDKPVRVVQFESVSEFTKQKDTQNCIDILRNSVMGKFECDGPDTLNKWFGAKTKADVERILDKGDSSYVDMVRENEVRMPPPESIKRRKIRGEYGDEVCIHKINSGNLSTAWSRRSPKARVGSRNIRLIISTSNNWTITAEQLSWIGVTALVVAEGFEAAGYNLAIDVIMHSEKVTDQESIVLTIPVKHYESPLDIQSLSSVVCCPAFFRWSGFMNYGLAKGTPCGGLGCPINSDRIKKEILPKYYRNPSEIVELISNECLNKEEAMKEITRLTDKFIGTTKMAA